MSFRSSNTRVFVTPKSAKFNVDPDKSENKCYLYYECFTSFKKDRDFARSLVSGKLILAAAGPTLDSLFFGQVEIASGRLILATVGPTHLLLKKLISTPVNPYQTTVSCDFIALSCLHAGFSNRISHDDAKFGIGLAQDWK